MWESGSGLYISINYKGDLLVNNKIQEAKTINTLLYKPTNTDTDSEFTMIKSSKDEDEVTSLFITLPYLRIKEIILSINEYKELITPKNTRDENRAILQNIVSIISDSI